MAEDEAAKPTTPEASQPATEDAAKDESAANPAPPAVPAAPPNKLHEWAAAVGLMVFLALVLWVFLNFLRSASM